MFLIEVVFFVEGFFWNIKGIAAVLRLGVVELQAIVEVVEVSAVLKRVFLQVYGIEVLYALNSGYVADEVVL
jgi:hypothetical protein